MIQFSTISIILLSILAVTVICCISVSLAPLRTVARYDSPSPVQVPDGEEDNIKYRNYPKVSVIVYVFNDFDLLGDYLGQLSVQDYPDFEIIVVCDASAETSAMLAEKYDSFENLYITFVPPGSHNLSRRKLANTIGFKAAKGEIVVTTVANAVIPSEGWLTGIVTPLVESRHVDLSLGYARFDFHELTGTSRWFRQFDEVLTSVSWLDSAIRSKAWRANGDNIAFRRNIFFEHKGYAKSMNLHAGYDDIFINEISRPSNTKVILSPETVLTLCWGESARRAWNDRRQRLDFTRRWLPRGPQALSGSLGSLQWLALTVAATAPFFTPLILAPAMVSGALLLILWGAEIAAYRQAARRLGAVRLWWSVPLFILLRPICNSLFRLRRRRKRFKNYTWQRQK